MVTASFLFLPDAKNTQYVMKTRTYIYGGKSMENKIYKNKNMIREKFCVNRIVWFDSELEARRFENLYKDLYKDLYNIFHGVEYDEGRWRISGTIAKKISIGLLKI